MPFIDFDRDAASLNEAVLSAVADVERVGGVQLVRVVDAGLAAMADIAARTGRTREGVRLFVLGACGAGGPPPVTDLMGWHRLWRWSDVGRWFRSEVGKEISLRLSAGHRPKHRIRTMIRRLSEGTIRSRQPLRSHFVLRRAPKLIA